MEYMIKKNCVFHKDSCTSFVGIYLKIFDAQYKNLFFLTSYAIRFSSSILGTINHSVVFSATINLRFEVYFQNKNIASCS